ncbi:hypothetical protein CCO03_14200 [Comamonas serinivorans]|uniref:Uncharacterized protein n=1 Tax=Comamonas serinivorans TaxID=1082851 RepID=A0A1Y0EPX9_9BURK|nr:hypothetical protein CCO03_14200 [Comamonas serinivorans]
MLLVSLSAHGQPALGQEGARASAEAMAKAQNMLMPAAGAATAGRALNAGPTAMQNGNVQAAMRTEPDAAWRLSPQERAILRDQVKQASSSGRGGR